MSWYSPMAIIHRIRMEVMTMFSLKRREAGMTEKDTRKAQRGKRLQYKERLQVSVSKNLNI